MPEQAAQAAGGGFEVTRMLSEYRPITVGLGLEPTASVVIPPKNGTRNLGDAAPASTGPRLPWLRGRNGDEYPCH